VQLSRRSALQVLGIAAGVALSGPVMAFTHNKLLGGGSGGGGGGDIGSIKRLLSVAAKADAEMNAYFLIALGRKVEADKFAAAAQAMTEDTVDTEYDKLNELKDEHPLKADDLANFKPNKEANEALAAGNAMGSVALMNYALVLPQLAKGINTIKSNPMMLVSNIRLLETLGNGMLAIPSGISTITNMVQASNAISEKNDIPVKSKEEIAELSESVGGTGDVGGLPE
jgi:hypothetical protein